MIKFAIASSLLLQVAFCAEASLGLEGNVNSFIGDKMNSLGESTSGSFSASAEFETDVEGASDLEDKFKDIAVKISAAAESIKYNAADALAKLASSLMGISQNIKEFNPSFNSEAGSSMEPSFNAQVGGSMDTKTPGSPRPFTNSQGDSNIRPSANAQGSLNVGGSQGA